MELGCPLNNRRIEGSDTQRVGSARAARTRKPRIRRSAISNPIQLLSTTNALATHRPPPLIEMTIHNSPSTHLLVAEKSGARVMILDKEKQSLVDNGLHKFAADDYIDEIQRLVGHKNPFSPFSPAWI